ncbi:MAG: hypothetical protein M9894_27285 [Planctomycetes bacterium]|nr:hypothetical protein [Planctomycetota bacterium]
MSAQDLTPPRSAEQIEATHSIASSEGHQVPGPPHAHGHDDHDHGHDVSGPVIAVIVFLLLLLGAAWIGLRAPQAVGHDPRPAQDVPDAPAGVVVLDDGRSLIGPLLVEESVVTVRTIEGEVVVPRERVRWMRADGVMLTDDYWRHFGHLPVDAQPARRGGIVVTDDGEVFVGHVVQDARGVTVRWPYGERTVTGEVTIPRDRVRWVDPTRDTLGDEYWRRFEGRPLDPRFRRPEAAPPARRPAEQQQGRTGGRSDRNAATLAQASGRWGDAARAWARVYGDTRAEADLKSLLHCARRHLEQGFQRRPPLPVADEVRALLEPFAGQPAVRQALHATALDTASFYLSVHDLTQARRWTTALQGLGAPREQVEWLLRAAADLEHRLDEHDDDDDHDH